MTQNVGIFIYDEVEVLDFAGPFEVFSTASRVKKRMAPDDPDLFNVFTIGENPAPVFARGGLEIKPRFQIHDHPPLDVMVIPGGVVTAELDKSHIALWISAASDKTLITASVCTGAFLLAKAGLLRSGVATTHWEDIPDLEDMFPDLTVKKDVRWVDQGDVVTSAGISAGIDMSLHLVSRMAGRTLAEKTARQMDFDWIGAR